MVLYSEIVHMFSGSTISPFRPAYGPFLEYHRGVRRVVTPSFRDSSGVPPGIGATPFGIDPGISGIVLGYFRNSITLFPDIEWFYFAG